MVQCKMLQKKVETEDWLNFLCWSDLKSREVYFGLKIMRSIQVPYDDFQTKEEKEAFKDNLIGFYKRFISFDGFLLLCETLLEFDANNILKDVVWLSIFQMTFDILRLMLLDQSFKIIAVKSDKMDSIIKAISKTINHWIYILELITKSIAHPYNLEESLFSKEEFKSLSESGRYLVTSEYRKFETEFIESLFGLLKGWFYYWPEKINALYTSDFIKSGSVINLWALHPNPIAMRKAAEWLVEFWDSFKDWENVSPIPAQYFLKLLWNQLEYILSMGSLEHTDYFTLWDHILRIANAKVEDIGNIEEIVQTLFNTLQTLPVIEDDIVHWPILAGCLLMLKAFDELFHKEWKDACPDMYSPQFLDMLLSKWLFNRDKFDPSNSEITFPLWKSEVSRKCALNLIKQIFGHDNLDQISNFLVPIIKNGSWRSNKREKWFIQSSILSHRMTHVGLVNLGWTWYMNSMMQQFFMSPFIRSLILIWKDYKKNEIAPEDNVLYQSKFLFANLIQSKMPTYNPIQFFNSIKDSNGEPMPTNEQKDIDEFLSIYNINFALKPK